VKYTERADDLDPTPDDLAESSLPSANVAESSLPPADFAESLLPTGEFSDGSDPNSEFAAARLVAASARNAVPAAPPREPLPPLETLVERIPQPVRDALEDLFRARFTSVRRLPAPTEPAPSAP